ncbi:MAG: fimbrillin family protein [Rikenellaceae bacterium]
MKKIAIYTLLAAMAISCSKESSDPKATSDMGITIDASIADSTTRSEEKSAFEKNDTFGLSMWYDDDNSSPQAANMSVQNNGYSWVMSQTLEQSSSATTYNFAAIYPRPETTDLSELEACSYQAPEDMLFVSKSMSAADIEAADGVVSLAFEHLMARITINITFENFDGTLPSVITLNDLKECATINAFTGDITAYTEGESVDLELTNNVASRIVVPQTISSFEVVFGDFTYSYTGGVVTQSGKNTTCYFTITRENLNITLDSDVKITDWDDDTEMDSATATPYWSSRAATSYDGGDGSENSPYEIRTAEQLAYFAKVVNEGASTQMYKNTYFKLTEDINLTGKEWTPIGIDSTVSFVGFFDGDGHTVSNLTISNPVSGSAAAGLFGRVNGQATTPNTTIENVTLVDPQIKIPTSASTVVNVGGIAGYINNNVVMTQCKVEGGVISSEGVSTVSYLGGIAGNINAINVTLTECSVSGTTLTSAKMAGGIVAIAGNPSSYIGCSVNATITGSSSVAGLIANDKTGATVTACYTAGVYSGGTSIGGLFATHTGTATSCYSIATTDGSTLAPLSITESGTLTECYADPTGVEIETMNGQISTYEYVTGDSDPFPYILTEKN